MGSLYEKFKKAVQRIEKDEGTEERGENKSCSCNHGGGHDNKKSNGKNDKGNIAFNLIVVLCIGILLVIVGSMFNPSGRNNANTKDAEAVSTQGGTQDESAVQNGDYAVPSEYKDEMQKELVSTLEKIEGVGKVHAMIYFSSGIEQIPVFDEDASKSTTNEDDNNGGHRSIVQENGGTKVVMENDGSGQKPFVTRTDNPKITGVCIVAEGASDNVTELRIRQAVTSLFGLQDVNVQVYPMEK